jgi:cytochrome c553
MTGRSGKESIFALLLVAAAVAGCSAPEPGVARGADVWNTCVPCHGSVGEGKTELGAPAIAGLPAWYVEAQLEKFENSWRGNHPQDTVGLRMKSMARALDRDGDRESVALFVESLPVRAVAATVEGGNATTGQEVYGRACLACHGDQGQGVQLVNGPPLAGVEEWYLLEQFQKFRNGWRGVHPEDVPGQIMAANARVYSDQDVIHVIAYLRTLQ